MSVFESDSSSLWAMFEEHHRKQRLAHAILLTDSLGLSGVPFSQKMASVLLCKTMETACGYCQSCQLMAGNEHPDLVTISPEKIGSAIKIDQIRALQPIIFTTPQLSNKRIVRIYPAEKMNHSATNSLLKILEEPPPNTWFILIAQQISTLPATIISRCQHWRMPLPDNLDNSYLAQGSYYPIESAKGKLFSKHQAIIEQLNRLQKGDYSVNFLAQQWSEFDFNELIWLLYLINAQMISYSLQATSIVTAVDRMLKDIAQHIKPVRLYTQIDKLNEIIRNLNHTISINQLLTLEELLAGYA